MGSGNHSESSGKWVDVSELENYSFLLIRSNCCLLLFQQFLTRKMPFGELSDIFVEVVEHWDDLLAYLVENSEGLDVTGHNANSVQRDVAADRTLPCAVCSDCFDSQGQ